MQTTTRNRQRIQRTREAIEAALEGAPTIENMAVLVSEKFFTASAIVMTREELLQHLDTQRKASTDPREARMLGQIRTAAHAVDPQRAPVVIACIEGFVLLESVSFDADPRSRRRVTQQLSAFEMIRREVLKILAVEPLSGTHLRDRISSRFKREHVGRVLTRMSEAEHIYALSQSGCHVTWALTTLGQTAAAELREQRAA